MKRITRHASLVNFDELPDSAHVRPKTAILLMGISIATFWRLVASRKITTHKLTERTTTVKVGDLREFMSGKVSHESEV